MRDSKRDSRPLSRMSRIKRSWIYFSAMRCPTAQALAP
jgi:hypothetical protein